MPVNANVNIPFLPQEGLTQQMLSAIQLANEHFAQQKQIALQQQAQPSEIALRQAQTQEAGANVEESKARTGLYGVQQQREQNQLDIMKRMQGMLGQPGGQPGQQPAPSSPGQQGAWLPSNTPPQLSGFVQAMLPRDLTDTEKTQIEAGAQSGLATATQSGDVGKYLDSIREGVNGVITNRNTVARMPENQSPTKDDISNFVTNTLPSYTNITSDQSAAAKASLLSVRSMGDLRRLEDRISQQDNEALTRKIAQDNIVANRETAHGQAEDLAGRNKLIDDTNKFGKTWSQMQSGLATIDAASNGNDLATRMIPTMEVLGINMGAGLTRINPQEARAASIPLEWTDRWNAWLASRTEGKLNPQQVQEGKSLMHELSDKTYQAYLGDSQNTVNEMNIDPKTAYVLGKDGTSIRLSDALASSPTTGATANRKPLAEIFK